MITMFRRLAAVAALLAASAAPGFAQQTELGVLKCYVSGGAGFIIGSTKDLECKFEGVNGEQERYRGEISKFGVDIGSTGKGVMYWTVLAPTGKLGDRALAGEYAGVTAGAAVGVGAAANALLGGSNKTVTLQPFSGQVEQGLNLALGIAEMKLY